MRWSLKPFGIIKDGVRHHGEFTLILVLAVAFRVMAVLVFRPGGYWGEMSDFGYYRLLLSFTSQGFYPLVDFWLEYPPIFPWLALAVYRLSLLIPAWSQAGAGFYVLLSMVLTLVEAGNLVLLYAIARRLVDQRQAVRLAWSYSALLIPVLFLFGGFDSLAQLFLLLAVLLTLDGRALATGVATGLGFMTKLVPISALPAALQSMSQPTLGRPRQTIKLLAATALTVALIAMPFLLAGPEHFIQSLKAPMTRSGWETIWALFDGYYSYGVAGGADRFDPTKAGAAHYPSRLPWLAITIGFGLLYLFLFTRRVDWTERRRIVAFTALTQSLLTLYFKGYSPQFLVMLLPFVILLIPGARAVAYALLLGAINLVEYPIYFLVLPDQHWLLTGSVLLRTLILVVISLEYAAQVYDWRIPNRWWHRVAATVGALVIVSAMVATVFGFRAYSQARYSASPHRPAMDFLAEHAEPGATVVTDQQAVYEELYPFLHDRFHVRLVETYDYLPLWEPRLREIANQATGCLWIYAPAGSPLHSWLVEQFPFATSQDFDGWRLSRPTQTPT